MNVKWSYHAQQRRKEMAKYIASMFGKESAITFHQNVLEWVATLTRNPEMGLKEPLLQEFTKPYRSVVIHKNCKLVYYVENKILYIADLWDTRREPITQANQLK